MKPAALYLRISTDKQDPRSIDDQEYECREWARRNGYQVVAIFSDEAISGTTTKRPGLQRMLAAARGGTFQAIIVNDMSRFSRDTTDFFILKRTLAARGVVIIERTSGRVSSSDPESNLLDSIGQYRHEKYVVDLSEKTADALKSRARSDFHTGGRCFGYSTVPVPNPGKPDRPFHTLKIDDSEADTVRRIFAAYAGGAGYRQIAAALNAEGVRAPYDTRLRSDGVDTIKYQKPAGRGWSAGTLRALLHNERYVGNLTYNRRRWFKDPETKQQKYRDRPNEEWIVKERPDLRIVDDLLWKKVQRRLGRREKRALGMPRHREERAPSPLSGLLWCGVCGSRMAVAGGGKGGLYRNFKCAANHVKGPEVCANGTGIAEAKTLGSISGLLASTLGLLEHKEAFQRFTSTFRRLLSARSKATATPPEELTAVEAGIRQESARVEKLVEAIVHSPRSDALSRALNEAEARLRNLEERRAGMQTPVAAAKVPMPSPARLRELFGEVEEALQASPEEARRVLGARLGRITLTPRETPEGPVYLLETTLKMEPAALFEDSRFGTLLVGCGARI